MYNFGLIVAFLSGWLYLMHWGKQVVMKAHVKRRLAELKCEAEGHTIVRVNAFDDPRFPQDVCTRCTWQTPVYFPCPHCGKEIKPRR